MKENASCKVNTRIPQCENTQLLNKGRKIRNRVKYVIKLITNIQLKLKTQLHGILLTEIERKVS